MQLPLPKTGHITGKMPKSVKMTDFLNSNNRDVLYIKRTALIYRRRWSGWFEPKLAQNRFFQHFFDQNYWSILLITLFKLIKWFKSIIFITKAWFAILNWFCERLRVHDRRKKFETDFNKCNWQGQKLQPIFCHKNEIQVFWTILRDILGEWAIQMAKNIYKKFKNNI